MSHNKSEGDLDSQFNLRARHPDFQFYFDRNETLSAETLSQFPWQTDIPYGENRLQTLDFVAANEPGSPVFLFIHGGYWKTLDKSSHRFVAKPFLETGCSVVNVNYRLAPKASIDEIVDDVVKAILWVGSHNRELQGDPNRIFIAGHSAGAHLALMSVLRLAEQKEAIASAIQCVYCVSGLFDLGLLMKSYLNEELRITPEIAKSCSPLALSEIKVAADLRFLVGSDETGVFVSQTHLIHEFARASGADASVNSIEGRHHFDILYELGDPKGRLGQELLNLIKVEKTEAFKVAGDN